LQAQREEEERREKEKQELEAKRAVKKGFLTSACKQPAQTKQADDSKTGDAADSEQCVQDHEQPLPACRKPLIQEMASNADQEACVVDVDARPTSGSRKDSTSSPSSSCSTTAPDTAQRHGMQASAPQLNFRQNDQNVTILVRVAHITDTSLKIQYGNSSVALDFHAGGESVWYQQTIHLWGDIEPIHCR
jgi:hypothetical protein